jgi:aryl-alcohol dehydrogenase-like predicted oxidoreductase
MSNAPNMKYRRLGKTELLVSVIGIGTWQLGGEWGKNFTQAEVDAIFDKGREVGINLIDTAECYGDHTSESLIGHAIERDRARWVVATKFGHKFHGHLNRTDERTALQVAQQLDDSLRALRTDYIDLYQYHSIRDSEFDDQELRAVLERAVQSGKVRHLGNSIGSANTNPHQVEASTAFGVEAIQVVYNRLDRKPEQIFFPICQRQDLGVLARVPLASGYLSGKYKPGAKFGGSDVRAGHDPADVERKLREVERIQREEVPAGVEMAAWALAWCLRNPAVTSVIPGCKDAGQVEANARGAGLV